VPNDLHRYRTQYLRPSEKNLHIKKIQAQFSLLYVSDNIFYRPIEDFLYSLVYLNNQSSKNPNIGQSPKGICLDTTSKIGPKQQTCSAASGIQTVVFQIRLA